MNASRDAFRMPGPTSLVPLLCALAQAAGRRAAEPPTGSISGVAERLAVLLEAGVAPSSAWQHVSRSLASARDAAVAASVAAALAAGRPGAPAIVAALGGGADSRVPGRVAGGGVWRAGGGGRAGRAPAARAPDDEWRQLAAAWAVAERCGSPLAPCLRSIADATRALTQARRDAETALSGPRATGRLVLGLPAIGLLLGLALGLDTMTVLVASPIGWFCVVSASVLVVMARAWNRRLIERARPSTAVAGLRFELLAVALGGGGAWSAARRAVEAAMGECCPELAARSGTLRGHAVTNSTVTNSTVTNSTVANSAVTTSTVTNSAADRDVDDIVRLSEAAGVPGAGLLRAAADDARREARAVAAAAAERLGVWLMLPLGVCILPAFLLVGVVPLFVALLSSTGLAG